MNLDVIYNEDCLLGMQRLPDSSVDLIATDPPYFRVKGEAWDRQWDSAERFIEWIGELCRAWQRVLKPNGSLYVFASPQMAARVEVKASERFNVLNRIRWIKTAGWHNKARREDLRSYLSPWEEILFAEHQGMARNPIANAIAEQRTKSAMKATDIDIALGYVRTKNHNRGTELCRRWEEGSSIPTCADFVRAFHTMGSHATDEELRTEYETLRTEYETLRRPFAVSADVPFTDVWTFPTVSSYPGKHPCEKPLALMEHIITASSRPGAVVLDSFLGSGTTAVACLNTNRHYIGFEKDPHYFQQARKRIANHKPQLSLTAEAVA